MGEKKDKDLWNKNKNKKGSSGPDNDEPLFKFNRGQFRYFILYFILSLILLSFLNSLFKPNEEIIEYSQFKRLIVSGEIKQVEMGPDYYRGLTFSKGETNLQIDHLKVYKTIPVNDPSFVSLLDEHHVDYFAVKDNTSLLGVVISWILPFVFLLFFWSFISKRIGGMGSNVMSFGQNRARIVADTDLKTTFKDVAGVEEAKEELVEVVDFLKNPTKYTSIGGKIPKGVLLVGPPGTGKTLLARAVAGEASVPFFRMSGADFVEMFVGVGAARVRDLFKQAREKAPCIIFIDELDAIGKSRSSAMVTNDEREQTLNQLLVEMDGFDSTTGVIILAATNRPEILDPALLRPGRFDRQVLVDRPDLAGREAILKIHAKNVKLDESVDLNEVAKSTPGFVGSDLANIVNEAALLAVRNGREKVAKQDFEEAIEKAVAGLQKKNRLINPKEKEIVAYHETGHALVAAFTPGSDPVQKISIVPRGMGALGYTLQIPIEDRYLMTEDELLGRIDVLLGGRAAEDIIFGKISTGAANDLQKATDIAKNMITEYGMSEKFKNVYLSQKGSLFLQDNGVGKVREYSEQTQQYIDEEISRTMQERYARVKNVLIEKQGMLEKVARKLLEVEILSEKDFKALLEEEKAIS